MIRITQRLPSHRLRQCLHSQYLMLIDMAENQISQFLGLVAHIHHFAISTNAFQAFLTDMNDEWRSTNGIVAVRRYVDLDAGLSRTVQCVPMGAD